VDSSDRDSNPSGPELPIYNLNEDLSKSIDLDLSEFFGKLRKIGLFIQDREHGEVYPNIHWYRWGYDKADMKDGKFIEFVHPDDRPKVKAALDNLERENSGNTDVLFRLRTRDGQWRWIYSTSISVSRDEEGRIRSYIGFDYDVTDQMKEKQRAERLASEARTLASAAAIINGQLDLQHTIDAILQQAELVVPFSSASVQINRGDSLEIIGGRGFLSIENMIGSRFPIPGDNPNTKIVETRMPLVINSDLEDQYPDFQGMSERDILCWMGIPLIHRREIIGVMTYDRIDGPMFTDEELELGCNFANHVAIALSNATLYEETRKISVRDHLTGVYNRRWMFDSLQREMESAQRYGHSLSLLLFDFDNFKQINDIHGHVYGDQVLITVSGMAQSLLRGSDILCRYGGEEFAAILPHSDEAGAKEIGNRIRESVENCRWEIGEDFQATISLGAAAMIPGDIKRPEALVTRADQALYYAKNHGKNRCTGFSELP
jgi:diguanylate cyclase (GGDEF)-like protein/PAS domain S-box-containing protein